jgi:hypothetical protein
MSLEPNYGHQDTCLSWLSCLIILWLKREARSVVSESNCCVTVEFVHHSGNVFVVLEEGSISNELQFVVLEEGSISNELQSNCFTEFIVY